MKLLTLLITGLSATATALVATPDNRDSTNVKTNELDKRGCYISCPMNRWWCTQYPYKYSCGNSGQFKWETRHTDCESPTIGCWCSCDWTVPGVGAVADQEVA
ncbi:uncharacterized protein CTRU02_208355 [Colletotrichum truncatum]|uniref:Uncharacterized protein n=1 Tax=Colletotrichum truncatum TaxID=5467 RepID=A0ACC3YW24_COLTU|nr:uncharacterized protein CTRU02_07459 [Colletotrichum truncatum]KAF6791119.1 hypothetical protein CTRU02_07459 [Colletotrichum truncatum]